MVIASPDWRKKCGETDKIKLPDVVILSNAYAKMVLGYELGLKPMTSLQGINCIKGSFDIKCSTYESIN